VIRLLVVTLHLLDEPLLVTRRQVAKLERRLGAVSRRERKPLAVRAELRADGAPDGVRLGERSASQSVEDTDLPEQRGLVVAAVAVAK
jgi:hypothetical protein